MYDGLTRKDLETPDEKLLMDPWNAKSFWCITQHRTTSLAYCRLTCGKKCKQVREAVASDE